MNTRNLLTLSVAALVLILGAWWLSTRHSGSTEVNETTLYPALKSNLDSVRIVRIYGKNNELVELARTGNQFEVTQRHQYPANNAKVRTLLMDLAAAKLREEKTSNPANYAALGVEDISANSTGTRVELVDTSVNLIVGKKDAATHSTYIRRTNDKASWLIDIELTVAADPTQWLQRQVVNIAADRIVDLNIQAADTKHYLLLKTKPGDANFDVANIPKGRELSSISVANASAQTLADLQLEDVRAATELSDEKALSHVVLRTFDGLVIHVSGYGSEQHWITLKADVDEALAKRFHQPETKASADKPDMAKPDTSQLDTSMTAAIKKTRDEADAINKQCSDWAYAIPAHKYESLFKPLEQLLKQK